MPYWRSNLVIVGMHCMRSMLEDQDDLNDSKEMRRTVVIDQAFNISHDFCITAIDNLGHSLKRLDFIALIVRGRGLGV